MAHDDYVSPPPRRKREQPTKVYQVRIREHYRSRWFIPMWGLEIKDVGYTCSRATRKNAEVMVRDYLDCMGLDGDAKLVWF
jgi:hypothetical protein